LSLTFDNPENDPFGVDLQSALAIASYLRNFPSLESFSMGVIGITTLLSTSTASKEIRKDLA
jgi:hypothetical protein